MCGEGGGIAERGNVSDELDTIGYAVNYCEAARMLLPSKHDGRFLGLPFYQMICFALENAFKAVLEFWRVPANLPNWTHSHDLSALRKLALERAGLQLHDNIVQFVDGLSYLHHEHQFRYPQKAGDATLLPPELAVDLTNAMLSAVFKLIGGPDRLNKSQ